MGTLSNTKQCNGYIFFSINTGTLKFRYWERQNYFIMIIINIHHSLLILAKVLNLHNNFLYFVRLKFAIQRHSMQIVLYSIVVLTYYLCHEMLWFLKQLLIPIENLLYIRHCLHCLRTGTCMTREIKSDCIHQCNESYFHNLRRSTILCRVLFFKYNFFFKLFKLIELSYYFKINIYSTGN